MPTEFRRRPMGFTLIELMIVVSIIAILSAVAVLGFMRARKRTQATSILADLRILDSSIALFALENNKAPGDTFTWNNLVPYIKKGSHLYNSGGLDEHGHEMVALAGGGVLNTDATQQVGICSQTFDVYKDVVELGFWSPYGVRGP